MSQSTHVGVHSFVEEVPAESPKYFCALNFQGSSKERKYILVLFGILSFHWLLHVRIWGQLVGILCFDSKELSYPRFMEEVSEQNSLINRDSRSV